MQVSVEEKFLANNLFPGNSEIAKLPAVLSTPWMIALMECACVMSIRDALEVDELSLGVHVSVDHVSSAPIGSRLSVKCVVTTVHGRYIEWQVDVASAGKDLGRGVHRRVLVC